MMQHRGIWLPDGDTHWQEQLDKGRLVDGKGTYQLHKIDMAVAHCRRPSLSIQPGHYGRTAIDVGAHVGSWSRILAKWFDRVEAFEPVPEHRECFRLNVTAENVVLHPTALGACEGQGVSMVRCPGNSGNAHVALNLKRAGIAPLATLDSFELQDVDLIKIDCEGYELHVLKGAMETLRKWRPTIIVEQKPGNGSRYGLDDLAALAWLEERGARCVARQAGDFVFTW